jgi:mono/diheme cytochrome c family protein
MKTCAAFFLLGLGSLLVASCALSGGRREYKSRDGNIYSANCAKCHGDDGKGNTMSGLLSGAQNFTNSKWQQRTSDATIFEAIQKGPGLMPSFENKLSGREIDELVNFVRRFAE